ncbi:hypothetical protein H4V99_001015 [Cryobacterium sp. CG_9.6]|nr:hypothetical protein [Cryobacterium sp. CG_9.6]
MSFTLLLLFAGWALPDLIRTINLFFLSIGAGLRFLAHGQPSARWKILDLLGKEIAYYGAFIVLLTLAISSTPS